MRLRLRSEHGIWGWERGLWDKILAKKSVCSPGERVEVSGKNFLEIIPRLEERKETKSERFGIGFDVSSS